MAKFTMISDTEWRERLKENEYLVLRHGATEAPHVGEYTNTTTEGVYRCKACGAELFRSTEKFDAHGGWPSFFSPLAGDSVIEIDDYSLGMHRIEVRCATCESHLGHVFEGEGFDTPTDQRYCINSIALDLEERPVSDEESDGGQEQASQERESSRVSAS